MEVRFRVDVPLSLSLKNKKKIDSNKNLVTYVCVCLYVPYTVDAQLRIFLLMASLSAGVGGYSLCLFLIFFFPLLLPTFFWHFVDIFPFFFLLFSLVFSPYFLSSCWLPRILFSLSHFDLCVVISVYRLLQIWCFSNVMLLVSVFFSFLLSRFFIIFPSDLSVGSFAHLISQFFGWLTPPARHTLHPPFACPTIRLLLRLSSTAGYMNGLHVVFNFFHFKNFFIFFSHHFNLFCP